MSRRVHLQELTDKIRSIERRYHVGKSAQSCIDRPEIIELPTGWKEIDAALGGGLPAAGLHEWLGVNGCHSSDRHWSAPLCILVHLAWQAMEQDRDGRWMIWIGRTCHPYPRLLVRGNDRRLLSHSLFVAPRDPASRLWAIELALRSEAVNLVIADGSSFDRSATQRIQFLARAETKLVLAARPPSQQKDLSAAHSRWRVQSIPSPAGKEASGVRPRWSVELLRCKGLRPAGDRRAWLLEWNRVEGAVDLSSSLADLAGAPQSREVLASRRQPGTASVKDKRSA